MSKIYFASDFHLMRHTRERENRIVRWLDHIAADAEAIYLVGDLFDFWFEYKEAIPKGYVRFLGKLAELRDRGIPIYFFKGNHDMWMFRYFETEFDIPIYSKPIEREIKGKKFFIGHGDGLGPDDYGYKFLKKIFSNRFFQWCFARLHPNFGIGLANFWSNRSREHQPAAQKWLGQDKEWLYLYANRKSETVDADYFVFGHRHLPIDTILKNGHSRYINLGEWMSYNSYAVFDGEKMEVKFFENEETTVFGIHSE